MEEPLVLTDPLVHLQIKESNKANPNNDPNAQDLLHLGCSIRRNIINAKLIRNLVSLWNAAREFLLCCWCNGIFMSIGNQGSQNYNEERSQRVELQGYISWVFVWIFFLICATWFFTDIFYCPEQKKKKKRHCCAFVWMWPGYMHCNSHFYLFLITISICTSFPTNTWRPHCSNASWF